MRELIIADREHLSGVASLESSIFNENCTEKSFEMFCGSDNAFMVLCLEDGEIASYCSVLTVLDEGQIINVATADGFRRRGCARAVIERVIEESIRRGLVTLSLEVRERNAAAQALYEGAGFFSAGKRKDFYKNPRENALVMIKNID